MIAPSPPADRLGSAKNDRDGSLVPLLFILTFVTGLVDAVSYLKLQQVFVANMTGNVVFLGFAVAGAQGFSISASLVAVAAFLVGAVAGGRLSATMAEHRIRFFAVAILVELVLVGIACVVAITIFEESRIRYGLIVLLALAMGMQNAAARFLAVPDMTTTVLTLTLTGLAADSTLTGGKNLRAGRRLLAAGAMLVGAAVGALFVLRIGVSAALALTFTLLAVTTIGAYRVASRRAERPA